MILFFDTETTGLPDWNADPVQTPDGWPWPVEVAWLLYDRLQQGVPPGPGGPLWELIGKASYLVRPDGWTISQQVTDVHGITQEMAEADGIDLKDILWELVPLLTTNAAVDLVVGHNVVFDWAVIMAACMRVGMERLGRTMTCPRRRCCTMQETTEFCRLPGRRGYKWPTLGELAATLGIPFSTRHRAMADVECTASCWFELERRGFWGGQTGGRVAKVP